MMGTACDLDVFKKIGAEGVSLLLSDSTNVEKTVENESEEKIYHIIQLYTIIPLEYLKDMIIIP